MKLKCDCIYRDPSDLCLYMYLTGEQRGCDATPNCARRLAQGEKKKSTWNGLPKKVDKPKRVLLTPEQRRAHHNALRKKERERARAIIQNTNFV